MVCFSCNKIWHHRCCVLKQRIWAGRDSGCNNLTPGPSSHSTNPAPRLSIHRDKQDAVLSDRAGDAGHESQRVSEPRAGHPGDDGTWLECLKTSNQTVVLAPFCRKERLGSKAGSKSPRRRLSDFCRKSRLGTKFVLVAFCKSRETFSHSEYILMTFYLDQMWVEYPKNCTLVRVALPLHICTQVKNSCR